MKSKRLFIFKWFAVAKNRIKPESVGKLISRKNPQLLDLVA